MVHRDDDESAERAERMAQQSDAIAGNWERTLADLRRMAVDREDQGYEVVALASDDTTPLAPADGESDRWGFSHLVPGDEVPAFRDVYEGGAFTDTGVYQHRDGGYVYFVTESVDPDGKAVVLVAGAYHLREAPGLVCAATDRGHLYSHVRTLDRTYVGTFEHDDVSAFFPDPEAYLAYAATE